MFAAKQVKKGPLQKNTRYAELFKTELEVMKVIKHENLLHLHELIETEAEYFLITEYCVDGTLENLIKKRKLLPEPEAIFYLKQIMSAFIELHSKRIIHRDFKLANIYLNNGLLVIGDFGFAKMG